MVRVKRGIVRHRRHKKIRKLAKGYRGMRRTTFVKANEAVIRAGVNAYRDRKLKKRTFRSLWIIRLNAALRAKGIRYSQFAAGLTKKKIELNRKVLSELAIHEPAAFDAVVKTVMS
ncbi:MAG: large subunit ribosomal protein L20 [Candidatus Peregrinibacteria bacterium Greene0416_19]|nr:MAG: large subunit ribosomal protein L20 [Candidatus Peregrinibacteria bacterium Greene0416_19]